jgi:hypothetical protein
MTPIDDAQYSVIFSHRSMNKVPPPPPTLFVFRSLNSVWHDVFLLSNISKIFGRPSCCTRLKTHRLFQVDIDRREQCCAANYEKVVNHVGPSCYSWTMLYQHVDTVHSGPHNVPQPCSRLLISTWNKLLIFSIFTRVRVYTVDSLCEICFHILFLLLKYLIWNGENSFREL